MRKIAIMLAALGLMLAVSVPPLMATPEKAKQTGKDCSECHKGSKAGPHGKK